MNGTDAHLAMPAASTVAWGERARGVLAVWGWRRTRHRVAPGLYSFGSPSSDSPVFVSANYKLSFDTLRRALSGMDAWILALNTRGINVWCAAGKGTFGTDEIVWRIAACDLASVVRHRRLVLPQLGAPGVAAHEVLKRTGFRVVYGPVRARDIKKFLDQDMRADRDMRQVRFPLGERLMLAPMECHLALKYFLGYAVLAALFVWGFKRASPEGLRAHLLPMLGAILTGTVLTPALLPWLPLRSFALRGWSLGLLWAAATAWLWPCGALTLSGRFLLLPALSAFLALNFTGSSTFASPSGVNREIGLFARPLALLGLAGWLLMLVGWRWRP
ncbi:MAG: mercury methylation corrinoid protein HgcA [Elusimicrobiota bacterium]|jgi:hypothetical protein